ncbi:MAG: hypothetical protein K2N26_09230 [Oscillospiraceae bacterium]|nr:hypothetical protein [Oscillospiraceae bacterium]
MKWLKNAVIVFLVIAVWVLIFLVLPKILADKTLYLFGNFIAEDIFHDFIYLALFLIYLLFYIKYFKKIHIAKKIILALLYCVGIVLSVYDIAYTVNSFLAKEEISLTDGSKIVLYEQKSSSGTAIDVYKVKGIIAKYIGYCWEDIYCNEYCLKENKWDYTYNEADKKLTLILRYDEPRGEYAPDVLEEEFTLE